jgi:DNA-directed RNA polymerase specialized sigma24 family protein
MDHRPENPAKTYLRRYRALVVQQESLQRSIDAAYDRAYSCTQRIKPVHVQGGGGVYDRMAEDVARISDETEQLKAAKERAEAALAEILAAIQAVPDEMQRTVLTLRYVEGLDWITIAEKISYSEVRTYVIHGRGLVEINRWLEGKKEGVADNGKL